VGLTALAFVATLDIHPVVAWGVGLSGVAASLIRQRAARQVANVLVGIALLLYGLQSMGAAAGPLKHAEWLQHDIAAMLSSVPAALFAGFVLAAVLQSNTGAALLVITLTSGGVLGFETAVMMIYGTNLGAIVLRFLLSLSMRGTTMQLVRFEDLFCVVSGVVMVTLFYIERLTGVPLVMAAVKAVSSDVALRLAMAFFLSNLLPAFIVFAIRTRCLALLARIWPASDEADAAQPKYLTARSLEDPATAVDLIPRELARLLASLQASVRTHRAGTDSGEVEDRRAADYAVLTTRIEESAGQLATAALPKPVAERLNIARELTAIVDYIAEGYVQLRQSHRALRHFPGTADVRDKVLASTESLFGAAATAVDTHQPEAIAKLREQSRSHSELVEQTRESCVRGAASDEIGEKGVAQRTATLKLLADFELITWTVHRLAKLLERFAAPAEAAKPK
jgi:phosphate:Na+ symporter